MHFKTSVQKLTRKHIIELTMYSSFATTTEKRIKIMRIYFCMAVVFFTF